MSNIILLGPPASGKGTQCQLLLKQREYSCLGTGQVLRDEVHSGSELGVLIESYLNRGAYVPDQLIMRMVFQWLDNQVSGNWLLDGFPRTMAQAKALEDYGYTPDVVIGIDVDQMSLEERILSRLICSSCSATHSRNIVGSGSCPDCGGVLQVRSDDGIANFRNRFKNFQQFTMPLYDFYESKRMLIRVDGSHSPAEVFRHISKLL